MLYFNVSQFSHCLQKYISETLESSIKKLVSSSDPDEQNVPWDSVSTSCAQISAAGALLPRPGRLLFFGIKALH